MERTGKVVRSDRMHLLSDAAGFLLRIISTFSIFELDGRKTNLSSYTVNHSPYVCANVYVRHHNLTPT